MKFICFTTNFQFNLDIISLFSYLTSSVFVKCRPCSHIPTFFEILTDDHFLETNSSLKMMSQDTFFHKILFCCNLDADEMGMSLKSEARDF